MPIPASPAARMPASRSILAILLLALALPDVAAAADLYKCSDANGVVSIQSRACATGSTEVWKRGADPEPALSPEQAAQAEAKQERNARDARTLSQAAGTTPRDAPYKPDVIERPEPVDDGVAKGPCRRAHDLARDIRALALLEMRSDQLYRLDEWVVKQCEQARSGE